MAPLENVGSPTRTSIEPPRLSSLPSERSQLEYSSRSLVFSSDGERILRAWGGPERPFVVSVEPAGRRWRVEAWGVGPRRARAAARELFSLYDPLEEFYRRTRRDPVLRGTERAFRGLRIPRDANVYESLLHAIVGQQISVAAANSIKRRLLDRFGRVLVVDGLEVRCVPSPSRLVGLGADRLKAVGLSRAKSHALAALAPWAARNRPSAAELRARPLGSALRSLEALRGVGRWTAENALLRGAGRRDVFVAGDLGVRVALERFGAVPRASTEAAARAWAEERYPGWGSYATLYLWRKLVQERAAERAG